MLIFENKLPSHNRNAVIAKINSVSSNLGIRPNWLMAVINFETAGTFSPSIKNKYTGATGLIQFMPSTAVGLGTSTAQLALMPFEKQLEYVEKYYRPYKSKIKGFIDLYLATFFPVSMGKPDNWVLKTGGISAATIAAQNPAFDPFKTGKVTVGAIKKVILAKVPAEYIKYLTGTGVGLSMAAIAVGIFGFILYKNL